MKLDILPNAYIKNDFKNLTLKLLQLQFYCLRVKSTAANHGLKYEWEKISE